jgi:DMSO/TMAO reductase YedYZ molybdopterin-dependent catalytic subunit
MVRAPGPPVKSIFSLPDRYRVGPFRSGAFTSPLHSERLASILGIALGVTFSVCFVTGLISHLIQHPPSWFSWPPRPGGLYRVTQGLHVFTGIASIPLLLGKLWTVYPRLWRWPPITGLVHAIERLSLLPLVGGSLFLLVTGVMNIAYWYPFGFFFPAGHYWGAWITMGALLVHIGAKATAARIALRRNADEEPNDDAGLSRRGFLAVILGSAGVLVAATIGETFKPLGRFAVLAPRRMNNGPQGFPVNKTAVGVGVVDAARDPKFTLRIEGAVKRGMSFALGDLRSMPQREAVLTIACVEGWSADALWRGPPVRDLLLLAGVPSEYTVTVESLQESGLYKASVLTQEQAEDPDTLLALYVNDEVLHIDHGYPCRLIAPNRPGVMQTKWVSRLVVS